MVCPRCRAVNRPGESACFRCGYPLVDDEEQSGYEWRGTQADQRSGAGGEYRSGAGWGEPAAEAWSGSGQYGAPEDRFGPSAPYYQPGQQSRPMQPYQQYPAQQPYGGYSGYGGYGGYGPQIYGGQQPYPMDEPEVRSRNPLTAVLIVGIVILLIAMAGGGALLVSRMRAASANISASATATPTVPAGFITYTDPGGAFQLYVPKDWTTQPPSSTTQSPYTTLFENSDEKGVLTIASISGTFDQSALSASEKSVFEGMSTGGGGPGTYSHLQGPTTVSLGGEHWSQESADVAVAHGTTLHAVVLLANHAGHAYVIAYAAIPANFKSLDTKDFQIMLQSFKFLK